MQSGRGPGAVNASTFGVHGFEAFYDVAVTPWTYLTPDIRIVQTGKQRADTSLVLGTRMEHKF
jgi:hypothetical protein